MFTDLLDQADELFDKGYDLPAAVVAGSVMEDALRKLCDQHNVIVPDPKDSTKPKEKPTMNDYNIALMKATVYDKTIFKLVDSAAGIRNHAAHGERDKFNAGQVRLMIDQIRFFMAQFFAS